MLKVFVKNYIDQILIIASFLFVGLLVWFFVDSTAVITGNFSQAISPLQHSTSGLRFNLEDARKLDLRGLTE